MSTLQPGDTVRIRGERDSAGIFWGFRDGPTPCAELIVAKAHRFVRPEKVVRTKREVRA